MRALTRDEWEWIIFGAVPIGGFATYAWIAGLLGLYVYMIMVVGTVFYSIVWWTSTHQSGRLRFQLSVPCYALGWISTVVLLSFPSPLVISLPGLAASFLAASLGITYLAVHDFERIRQGKKTGLIFSKLNRVLDLGILFSAGGWFFLVANAIASSSGLVEIFQEVSLVSVTGRACVISGVILVTVAVSLARKNYTTFS